MTIKLNDTSEETFKPEESIKHWFKNFNVIAKTQMIHLDN
jgi:hypothetical protein